MTEAGAVKDIRIEFTAFDGTAKDFMASIGDPPGKATEIGDRVGRRHATSASVVLRMQREVPPDEFGCRLEDLVDFDAEDFGSLMRPLMANAAIGHALDVRRPPKQARMVVELWRANVPVALDVEMLEWALRHNLMVCFSIIGAEDD